MPKLQKALFLCTATAITITLVMFLSTTGNLTQRFKDRQEIHISKSITLNNEAIFNFTNGRYEEGLEQLDEALELDPNNSVALYNAGIFFIIFRHHLAEIRYGDSSEWNVELILDEGITYNERVLLLEPNDESTMAHYAENMTFIFMIRMSQEIYDYETLRKAKNVWLRLYTNYPKRVYWNYVDTCLTLLRDAGKGDGEEFDGNSGAIFKPDA